MSVGPPFLLAFSAHPSFTLRSLPALLLDKFMGPTEGSIFLLNYRTGVSFEYIVGVIRHRSRLSPPKQNGHRIDNRKGKKASPLKST